MSIARTGTLSVALGLSLLAAACGASASRDVDRPPHVTARASPGSRTTRGVPGGARPIQHTMVLGRSVQGRPIRVDVIGNPTERSRVLVVGCIHGNETAGIGLARRLADGPAPPGSALWIIPDLNPDGVAAGTRANARGVDLNRNFPFAWRRFGARGDLEFSGPAPLSEPESRIAQALILRIHPRITIWFHQHEAVTDRSGGNVRIERRFAALSGLPLVRLTRYPGSATGWQGYQLPGTTAFVVELPAGQPSRAAATRYVRAVRAVAAGP